MLAGIKSTKAFASSPRVREEFPDLDRSAQAARVLGSKAGSETEIGKLLQNRALAMSPRTLEIQAWMVTYDWDASKRNLRLIK